jgi:hypothetical protein
MIRRRISKVDLLPTGHCFDDALEYLNQRVLAEPTLAKDRRLELIHGIAIGDAGEPYAHAWCEEGRLCWDAALADGQRMWYSVRRHEFYAARRVHTITRYSVRQACLENLRSRHYGPWKDVYRALCGSGGRVVGRVSADASHARILDWGGR